MDVIAEVSKVINIPKKDLIARDVGIRRKGNQAFRVGFG